MVVRGRGAGRQLTPIKPKAALINFATNFLKRYPLKMRALPPSVEGKQDLTIT